jgi:hypothetical protein
VARAQFEGARGMLGFGLLVSITTLGASGCQPSTPLRRAGVEISLPDSWRPVDAPTSMVPGTPLAAWRGPEGASLVLYRTLPAPGTSAAMLAEGLANRLTNLPELKIVAKRTDKLAGEPAARVEVIAPGTGDALAPSGVGKPVAPEGKTLVPTRQVTIGIIRSSGPLFLSWHMPESAHERIAPDIEATLGSLKLSADSRLPSYSY